MSTEAPIAFIFFNRPAVTLSTLQSILAAEPKVLYLISDGGRTAEEEAVVSALRRSVEEAVAAVPIVRKIYADGNMGCARRVYTGITEAFAEYDSLIIIEDDCMPSRGFFPFAQCMLVKYADNSRVFSISGTYLRGKKKGGAGYGFSSFPLIWGWATWKRAWQGYDLAIGDISEGDLDYMLEQGITDVRGLAAWKEKVRFAKNNPFYTWDYQFILHTLRSRGLCIHPFSNLITNIGFGGDATHTKNIFASYNKLRRHEFVVISSEAPLVPDRSYNRYLHDEYFLDRITLKNLPYRILATLSHKYQKIWKPRGRN